MALGEPRSKLLVCCEPVSSLVALVRIRFYGSTRDRCGVDDSISTSMHRWLFKWLTGSWLGGDKSMP